jgi:hypothetical protein
MSWRRRGRREFHAALLAGALLGCPLFALNAAPAQAAPAWLPPTDLSAPGRDASSAAVAMDDAGGTVAVWERQDTAGPNHNVQVSTRDPGGPFSAPVNLSLNSTNPQVAMTPSGEAIAVWRHFDVGSGNYVIQASTRPPGGPFTAPVDVAAAPTSANVRDIGLAVNANGDTAAVWEQRDPGSPVTNTTMVMASVRPAGGSFSTPVTISPLPLVSGQDAEGPRVAIDAAGDVTAVWRYFDGAHGVVQSATRPAAAGFSAPLNLSDNSQNAALPDVAMDSAGEAIAVWTRSNGANFIVQQSSSSAGGSFAAPQDLSAAGQDATNPRVAMDSAGEAIAVWTRSNGASYIAQATIGTPAGSFSPPADLSAPGGDALDPEVAMNGAGDATVVWRRFDGANYIAQAANSRLSGPFSTPVDLSAPGQDAVSPQPAIDSAGDATAAWSRSDGTNSIAQAAGYDADAPQLRNLSIPSSGTVGVPVSFSVEPFDVWPIASTTFDFGDGASAAGTVVTHTYAIPGSYPVTVTATDAAGTSATAAGTIAISPSNAFTIKRFSRNKKRGTGTFFFSVPGPGRLVVGGGEVRRRGKRVGRAGQAKLAFRARGKALESLKRREKLKVETAISFAPDGGVTRIKHRTVILVGKRRFEKMDR